MPLDIQKDPIFFWSYENLKEKFIELEYFEFVDDLDDQLKAAHSFRKCWDILYTYESTYLRIMVIRDQGIQALKQVGNLVNPNPKRILKKPKNDLWYPEMLQSKDDEDQKDQIKCQFNETIQIQNYDLTEDEVVEKKVWIEKIKASTEHNRKRTAKLINELSNTLSQGQWFSED